MAYTAGAAQLGITPDLRNFHRSIGEQLDKEDLTFAKAGDRWGRLSADAFTARFGKAKVAPVIKPQLEDGGVRTELDGLSRTRSPKVKPDVDDEKAKVSLADLVRTRTATVRVKVSGLKSAASSIEKAFGNLKIPALGAGIAALGPSALGLGAGAVGAGAAFGAAAAGIGSFAAIAVPMFAKVTKAQTALTTATQAYKKASTPAQQAAALKQEAAATAGLTAGEKQLATELANLKSSWAAVEKAEQPVVAKSLAPWMSTVTEGMKYFPSVFTPASQAIAGLGREAKSAIGAPFWGTFFSTLGKSGKIAITGFGQALGHMADGFAHLFVTFAPDIDKLPGLIDGWASSFDNWAKHYSRSGLDTFIRKTFSPANMASLKGDLKSLGTVFGNIATATENMSPAAFAGLSNVLTVLSKLTPGQIEALALIYGGAKTAQSISSATSGVNSVLGLLGLGGKGKKGAAGAAGEAEEAEKGGSLLGLGALGGKAKGAAGGTALGLLVADGLLHLPGVNNKQKNKQLAKNPQDQPPTVPGLGKLPQSYETPFGMPGPHDPASANNWLTSFSPYERFFTDTIPKLWSTAYEGFERNVGSPVAAWFTNSLPHFFTSVIPRIWSGGYEGFERNVGSPVSNWFTNSLPHFFTSVIPRIWSGAYEGFMRNIGSPIANWFTSTLPRFFTGIPGAVGSWASGIGHSIATDVGNGFSAAGSWASGVFGRVRGWVTGAVKGAGSWLAGTGRSIATGVGNGFASLSSWVSGVAGRAKGWITGKFKGAGSWLTSAGRQVLTGLGNGYAALSGWLGGVAGRAKGWITGKFSGALSWLRGAGSNAAHGIGNGYSSASGWVSSVASRAKGWITGKFGGAGSWLYNAGVSVMNGLDRGLNAAVGGVERTLQWVTNHIPSWKGPAAADAVLLKPAGRLIMSGFTDELAAGIPGIRSVMGQATAAVGAGLNVPTVTLPGVPKVRGLDGASLNLTYTGPQGGLIGEIVKDLRAEIGSKGGGDAQGYLGRGAARR